MQWWHIFLPHSQVIHEIRKTRKIIMSAISEFAARVEEHQTKIDTAIDGIAADIAGLKSLIEELQNSPGEISPEDQALLDALEARISTLSQKAEALDSLTPPATPPA